MCLTSKTQGYSQVGQLGYMSNETLFVHSDAGDSSLGHRLSMELSNLISDSSTGLPLKVENASAALPLPPSRYTKLQVQAYRMIFLAFSIPSFVELMKEKNIPVASASINDHNTAFRNPYYMSRWQR